MEKRTACLSIGAFFTLLLIFSWITFADKSTSVLDHFGPINRTQDKITELDRSNERNVQVARQAASHTVNIRDFRLKIEYQAKGEYEIDYTKNDQGQIDGHVKKKIYNKDENYDGQVAITFVESLMDQLALIPETSKNEVLTKMQNNLGVDLSTVKNFELNVTFDTDDTLQIQEDFKPHKK
jgi:hypothetical protein